jgi:hypothetical protein
MVTDDQWVEATNIYRKDPVEGLALALHYAAMDGYNAFSDYLKEEFKKDKAKASSELVAAYTEFLVLFIHLLNRVSDEMLGWDGTTKVRQALLPHTVEYASRYYERYLTTVTDVIAVIANDAESSYAKCKYYVSPDGNSIRAVRDPYSIKAQFDRRLAKALQMNYVNFFDKVQVVGRSTIGTTNFFSSLTLKSG